MPRFASFAIAISLMAITSTVTAQANQLRAPFSFDYMDSCNKEMVHAEGLFHVVIVPNGPVSLKASGSAVGLTSGTKYKWEDVIHSKSETIVDGNTTTVTITGMQKLHLISKGASSNLILTVQTNVVLIYTKGVPIPKIIDNTVTVLDCRGSRP